MPKYLEQNRQTGSSVATDPTGRLCTVVVLQDVISTANLTSPGTSRLGLPSFFMDGQQVTRLSKGEYEVVGSGLKLHSDDPAAI